MTEPKASSRAAADLLTVEVDDPAPGTTVIRAVGEIDLLTAPLLHERIGHALPGCARLVVELAGVTFLASSGLQVLLLAQEAAAAGGVELYLTGTDTAMVDRVLRASGLDRILPVTGTDTATLLERLG
ncbi:MAG TPA: STAS domain-containing protein [Pseudonocardia sp.]|jgi:anti-sigma B factor antagonist|nr:STAS domain-containing protein [Pseudonocardia sp.]